MGRNPKPPHTYDSRHSARGGRPSSPSKQSTPPQSSGKPGGKGILTYLPLILSSQLTTSGHSLLSALSRTLICSCTSTEEDKQILDLLHDLYLESYNRHLDACLSLSSTSPPLIVHVFSMLCCTCLVCISHLYHKQQWSLWGQDR